MNQSILGPLLKVEHLAVRYKNAGKVAWGASHWSEVVRGVSFEIEPAETFALVGQSGCGKTTVARAVAQLLRPCGGSVRLAGVDLGLLSAPALRRARADLQIVFQGVGATLNPRLRAFDLVAEPLKNFGFSGSLRGAVEALFDQVQLPRGLAASRSGELSGGQRQRLAIARAMAPAPRLVILDEPTVGLDALARAHILNMLTELQTERGVSYLLISHDIAAIRHLSHRVAVLHEGRIAEVGPTDDIFQSPSHSITHRLIACWRQMTRWDDCIGVAR